MPDRIGLANPLEQQLGKGADTFTRSDLIQLIEDNGIELLTFHYTGLDGKLKALRLPITSRRQVEELLTDGERVDGSSLFKGMVDTAVSDLYVVPVYRTAFLDPFVPGSLNLVCRYLDRSGQRAPFTPDNLLSDVAERLTRETGMALHALGELEFFLLFPPEDEDDGGYPLEHQKGYHAMAPYVKGGSIVMEMVRHISRITGAVKYAHAEVGTIDCLNSPVPELDGCSGEQWEIEFRPKPIADMADDLVIARWIIREVARRHGCIATFSPKLEEGVAGNGLHFHLMLKDGDRNLMVDDSGALLETARVLIGGLCRYAASLTAFGNTVSAAYLRLVPGQEAPTKVCWSDLNRHAMIRVPLGWGKLSDLASRVNPVREPAPDTLESRQTVELRTADGSALIHLMLAGVGAAVLWAVQNREAALQTAERLYLPSGNGIDPDLFATFPSLPGSCVESARFLERDRTLYTDVANVPGFVLDYVKGMLQSEQDEHMNEELQALPADRRLSRSLAIMHRHIHRH